MITLKHRDVTHLYCLLVHNTNEMSASRFKSLELPVLERDQESSNVNLSHCSSD